MKLTDLRKNNIGTVYFNYQPPGCRKPQDFIVYPMQNSANVAKIQSDKMAGYIRLTPFYKLNGGEIFLAKGQYNFSQAVKVDCLDAGELLLFKAAIMSTASGKAGDNGVIYCDNSNAIDAL